MKPTIAIIGASTSRHKFGNKAVRAYVQQGWEVYPIHPSAESIEGQRAYPRLAAVPVAHLDRVSMYLPPTVGLQVLDDIASKDVGELWFNPGSASRAAADRAQALGLKVVHACSIVAIGVSPEEME
jgi:predicted CoA-binding protein